MTTDFTQAGLPQHADATNHRHFSQNHQPERKNHGRTIQDSVQSGIVPELIRAVPLLVEAISQYTHSISRGAGIGGSNNWTPGESPRAVQEVHQTQETHQFFTCTVPLRLTGIVVFTDERVSGEECAQATALLEAKKGAVSENYLPDASWQTLHTQGVLKSPLETPEPHVRGGVSMLHNPADHRDMSRCPTVLLAHGS